MPAKRCEYIKSYLNTTGDTTDNALVEPITGLKIPGDGLVLGDYTDMTDTEAKSYSDAANVGTLYGGRYQRILLDSAANAAYVTRGRLAYFLKETSIAGTSPFYIVTDISHALSADLIAGVFLSSVVPGYYGFIQVSGKATVLGAATLTGTPVVGAVLSAAALGTVDVPTQSGTPTYAQASLDIGVALTLPVAGSLFHAALNIPFIAF